MIVLVTGSRYATHDTHGLAIRRALLWATGARAGRSDTTVTHELRDGSAEGVDIIARRIAIEDFGWASRPFAADWSDCDPTWADPTGSTRPCTTGHRQSRANGRTWCPTAGLRRNQRMVDSLLAEDAARKVCVAFPIPDLGSRGTADCLTRAWRAKIPTLVFPLSAP